MPEKKIGKTDESNLRHHNRIHITIIYHTTNFYSLHCRHNSLHTVYRHNAQLLHEDIPYNAASVCLVDVLIIHAKKAAWRCKRGAAK